MLGHVINLCCRPKLRALADEVARDLRAYSTQVRVMTGTHAWPLVVGQAAADPLGLELFVVLTRKRASNAQVAQLRRALRVRCGAFKHLEVMPFDPMLPMAVVPNIHRVAKSLDRLACRRRVRVPVDRIRAMLRERDEEQTRLYVRPSLPYAYRAEETKRPSTEVTVS